MSVRSVLACLLAASCGGAETPVGPPREQLSILVRDASLAESSCPELTSYGIEAELTVSGVLGRCRVRVQEDQSALSICDRIPGKKERELALIYFVDQKSASLELLETTAILDLTAETREMVEVDFTYRDRTLPDDDGDGRTNVEELCAGTNPHDAG